MKKETLILIGLGAAALYFVMSKRRRGTVEVFSPEKISEEEFGTPTNERQAAPMVETGKTLLQSVKDIALTTAAKIKRRKATKDLLYLPGMKTPVSKSKFNKAIREQKRKQRQQKRAESRIRRKKVGEISILY
jgi:hypothetical protein